MKHAAHLAKLFTAGPAPTALPRPLFQPSSRFHAALALSFAVHALLLSLGFGFPEARLKRKDPGLEVVLVNSKSASRPAEAQVLAQANVDGGGNVDAPVRATSPLPDSRETRKGDELVEKKRRAQALEAQQKQLLAAARSERNVPAREGRPETQPEPSPVSGRELAQSALAMARMQAEIDRQVHAYNQRPRRQFIGVRAAEYRFAQYAEDWRQKVERVGNLNYPEAAKGKVYGTLVLTVVIRHDGTVERVEINRPSGHKVLDDGARRIVELAAPYAPFPPDIRRDTDIIEITRTWSFTQSDRLQTQ